MIRYKRCAREGCDKRFPAVPTNKKYCCDECSDICRLERNRKRLALVRKGVIKAGKNRSMEVPDLYVTSDFYATKSDFRELINLNKKAKQLGFEDKIIDNILGSVKDGLYQLNKSAYIRIRNNLNYEIKQR